MTTSNQITLDHIYSYLSVDGQLEKLDLAPTATGGVGINNIEEFPPPKPLTSISEHKGTEYVQKYRNKGLGNSTKELALSTTSFCTLNDLNDVEDLTTANDDVGDVDELQSERTKQIYSTYYSIPNKTYDPDLAITNYKEEILQELDINPVVIIQGPTGCGKTTQVPQYILDYYAAQEKFCNIIVTQPRKIAAIGVANRVCQERKWQLGTFVGYQVAMDPKVSSDTRLTYVTTGVLLEKLVTAKRMDMFTHVIIDEVHERNEEIDFALLLVKKFLLTNSQKVKVILMSATFDTSMFAEYFASSKGDRAPIIEIIGKTKEVTEHYLSELKVLMNTVPDFDIHAPALDPSLYDVVIKLMEYFDKIEKSEQDVPNDKEFAPNRGAVLIFLPGYDEISALSNKLKIARLNKKFWIIPLHSTITIEEQTKVFRNPPFDHRKVILSTNIAESSITVPDIKYVIDFCLTKNLVTDPKTNYTCLQLEWASKANCIQRKGRAGRVDIGKVYRMVQKPFYDLFDEYSIPEIKRCPLTRTILHLKKLGVGDPKEMLAFALDPPYLEDIENAILQLKEALALYGRGSTCDGDLTFIGLVMANLPLDIKLSKLILFGYAFSCLEDCIIIAASLSLQSFFARPFQKVLESYRSRLSWANQTYSDCFAYLNAFKMWKRMCSQSFFTRPGGTGERDWGEKNYIQMKRIKEVDKLVREIKSRLEPFYITSYQSEERNKSDIILKLAIAGAFFPQYYLQEALDEKNIIREVNDNDPLSTVKVSGLPENHGILYACALKDMFTCCSDQIDIEFEERHAYIKFGNSRLQTQSEFYMPAESVAHAMYLAVKMRELQMPLELFVFNTEEAERKIEQIKKIKSASSETKLVSNRFSVTLNPQSTLEKIILPDPSNMFVRLFISHCLDCGHFWARYTLPETSSRMRWLETTINFKQGKNLKPLERKLAYNMLCLAPYTEGKDKLYYRAQIKSVSGDFAMVFFIDYGNEERIHKSELREIDENSPDVRTTRPLAMECFLSEIKPSALNNPPGVWSPAANSWFKRTINGEILTGKVYSVVKDTIRLELLKNAKDGTIQSINRQLITMGFADPSEESLQSKQNHEFRMKCSSYGSALNPASAFSSSLELSLEDAVEFSNLKTTNRKIRLRGPSSPLEASYVGLTNMDRSKCIRIERDGVNSVSFNPDPENVVPTMLIASHLSIGQKSDSLFARNTTLMPKLQGLPSLICMLFAPYAEIRTDRKRKSYIGALCGLGYDTVTGESLYKEHDIEIAFDTEITLNDISDINAIRMGLNMLLQNKEESKNRISHCQELLKEFIMNKEKLILKPRKSIEPSYYHKSGEWNQVPSRLLLEPTVDTLADCLHVLPLHKPPSLIET